MDKGIGRTGLLRSSQPRIEQLESLHCVCAAALDGIGAMAAKFLTCSSSHSDLSPVQ